MRFINATFILFFFTCLCVAQTQQDIRSWQIGCIQEFQKLNHFSSLRLQMNDKQQQLGLSFGFSTQKAAQHIFAPSATFDFYKGWKLKRCFVGPAAAVSADTYFFGTRFYYFHASLGYRFLIGNKWQFYQESRFGPTTESFIYNHQKNRQFTFNYHLCIGVQHALG